MSSLDNLTAETPKKCPRCNKGVPTKNVKTWREEAYGRDAASVACNICDTIYHMINTPPYPKEWTLTKVEPLWRKKTAAKSAPKTKKAKPKGKAKRASGTKA